MAAEVMMVWLRTSALRVMAAEVTMVWLRTSAFLILSVLLARKVCSRAGAWLIYLWFTRPYLKSKASTTGIDVRNKKKLQVILCGIPRTGTMSLMRALNILGFPCFHGIHLMKPTNADLFLKAFRTGNSKHWQKLLDGYAAIADVPAACAYKQLMGIFPNAKIILNIRDPNKWYDSFSKTLVGVTHDPEHAIFRFITPIAAKCIKSALYDPLFSGKPQDREICIKAYVQHTCDVKQCVASPNLLIYDIEEEEEGWSRLCEFLNVPIPDSAFPRTNNRKLMRARIARVARTYTIAVSMYVAVVACVLAFLLC
ncbi:hypothetical protein L7F22_068922 [Adiantum nelumboides]|nr:hypothetical protein [Adiantum nelumboides]